MFLKIHKTFNNQLTVFNLDDIGEHIISNVTNSWHERSQVQTVF